jgi:hypothetical protein
MMADTYVARPRQCEWMIRCHAGEIVHNICQQAVLSKFTEEELSRMAMAIQLETQHRQP